MPFPGGTKKAQMDAKEAFIAAMKISSQGPSRRKELERASKIADKYIKKGKT